MSADPPRLSLPSRLLALHAGKRYLTDFRERLRGALPRLQSADSRLGHEFEVARSYVHLVARARHDPVAIDLRLPEPCIGNAFRPACSCRCCARRSPATNCHRARLRLEAQAQGGCVQVRLEAAQSIDALDVAQAQDRVRALFGASARVLQELPPAGHAVVIELPRDG